MEPARGRTLKVRPKILNPILETYTLNHVLLGEAAQVLLATNPPSKYIIPARMKYFPFPYSRDGGDYYCEFFPLYYSGDGGLLIGLSTYRLNIEGVLFGP